VKFNKHEGSKFKKNNTLAIINGKLQSILIAERVALNFLSCLSGVSTATNNLVEKVKGTKTKVLDTRKTTPNLRLLEKYAVKTGGGKNHRFSLADAVLIKDNHLRASGCLKNGRLDEKKFSNLIKKIRKTSKLLIEVESENLSEFKSIIKTRPDIAMLDNFSPKTLKKAVQYRNKFYPRVKLEASGGITTKNINKIAKTGVDFISTGSITHSSSAIDFSLEIIDG
jgi:nicotinate-nucleotide pyrophosphorylase (carboxylating)